VSSLRLAFACHLLPGDTILDPRCPTIRTVTSIRPGLSNGWLTVESDGAPPMDLNLADVVRRSRPGQVEKRSP